jgi:glycosyltransferase involved in cell wall biosynthesis
MEENNIEYKVIIICTTFNHVKYVEDAMLGFVRQKTSFPYCALMIDDFSTDGTQEIIRKYESVYPNVVKGLYLQRNLYNKPLEKKKYVDPWIKKTQYLAFCEGDDYWINDYKLQRQVDFLDTHPDYLLHFHNCLTRWQDKDLPDYILSDFKSGDFTIGKLFKKWQLPYASVVMRKEVLNVPLYMELNKVYWGGFCKFIAAAAAGKVYGLAECLSVYRRNDGGVSNRMTDAYCIGIDMRLALVSKDKEAIHFMKRWILKQFIIMMPRCIMGSNYAKDFVSRLKKYDPKLFYYAILLTPFMYPFYAIKRLKEKLSHDKYI